MLFNLVVSVRVSNPFRDPKWHKWIKFGQIIMNEFSRAQIDLIHTTVKLESKVGALKKGFEFAYKVWYPAKRACHRGGMKICHSGSLTTEAQILTAIQGPPEGSAIETVKKRSRLDHC